MQNPVQPAETAPPLPPEEQYAIAPQSVEWTARALKIAERSVGLSPHLHDPDGLLQRGDIFLFNHFARFETIFPPLYLYRETGVFARSVAHQELFKGPLGVALSALGAVPHALPGLLPFLASEILRGRKVVIFPEGGMVKDRRVQDADGEWAVYSPTAKVQRPHHTGAAILALMVDACKLRIRSLAKRGDSATLERWVDALGLHSSDALISQAMRPTFLVPGHITFYPLRPPDQWTQKALSVVERFRGQALPNKLSEELLIESGLLFRDTDMDIRLGAPIPAREHWQAWERLLVDHTFSKISSLQALFDLTERPERWVGRLTQWYVRHRAEALRDQWSGRLYRLLTVNISHLLATLCQLLVERGQRTIATALFFQIAYHAAHSLRSVPHPHLHDSLGKIARAQGLLQGQNNDLKIFLDIAEGAGLISRQGNDFVLSPAITDDSPLDRVRLDNPLRMLVNEAAPLREVRQAVSDAIALHSQMPATYRQQKIALAMFEDQRRALDEDRAQFNGPEHAWLNAQQTATADGAPFFLLPPEIAEHPHSSELRPLGVLLVHGFLASPSEMRPLGDRLLQRGFPVMGVRLAGHGTSPWDLRERRWEDWLASVQDGLRILHPFCHQVAVVGFSTGGALALALAAGHPQGLAGVASIAAPLQFVDRRMVLVPWLQHLSEATRWRPNSDQDGLSFRPNHSEHPQVNYTHIPLAALQQLRTLTQVLPRLLPQVHCPAVVIQGDHDPVVDPVSAQQIFDAIGSRNKRLHWVKSTRHGLVYDHIGDTIEQIIGFVDMLRSQISP
jgi:esterase/lipase